MILLFQLNKKENDATSFLLYIIYKKIIISSKNNKVFYLFINLIKGVKKMNELKQDFINLLEKEEPYIEYLNSKKQ
jgi:hypothetical protein